MQHPLKAGAAAVEITPQQSMFLAGYPHVRRYSTGVHDPLLSSALYLQAGETRAMLIANDIIYVPKASVARVRQKMAQTLGIAEGNILISATHTHSGPETVDTLATEADSAVPKADVAYVSFMEEGMVEAAVRAAGGAVAAEVGLEVADATGVGTNRRDPAGPKDLTVPVMLVREASSQKPLAGMMVCSMHPTVLHEDSTLISGDFPGLARLALQKQLLGTDCPVLYHTGPAGNQSPRHVVRSNTFDEAQRLGTILARNAGEAIRRMRFEGEISLQCRRDSLSLAVKTFPSEAEAQKKLEQAVSQLARLRESGVPRAQVRTAECDWFGAQETLTLSRASTQGRLLAVAQTCMPAELQAILIG